VDIDPYCEGSYTFLPFNSTDEGARQLMDATDMHAMNITAAPNTSSLRLLTLCQRMVTIFSTLVLTAMVLSLPLWSSGLQLLVNGWPIQEIVYSTR